jgi:hypothetical protein
MADKHVDNVIKNVLFADDVTMLSFGTHLVAEDYGRSIVSGDLPEFKITDPALKSDETAVRIITNLMERRPNTPFEIGWAVRRLHFLFEYMHPERNVDRWMLLMIRYFGDVPVFVSPDKIGERSELGFGSLFWAVETARQFKAGTTTSKSIGNDEETLLSVIGFQYSLLRSIADMPEDEPRRTWVRDALVSIYMTNKKMQDELRALYDEMRKTQMIRGNSVFALLGIFLDSYSDSSNPQYNNTLIAYEACIKNVYVPWCRLK